MGKPRVLCIGPYFLPSQNGGGSVTALVSLVERLKADFDIVVATGDRDLFATKPYSMAEQQDARLRTGVEIHYIPQGWSAIRPLQRLLEQDWQLIHLNSFLSRRFCALPLLLMRMLPSGNRTVLLAPRGELMGGALVVRRAQKLLYMRLLRALGLLRGVRYHATSAVEAEELRLLGMTGIELAADLPPLIREPLPSLLPGAPGPLQAIFLSRIETKKNLLFALQALRSVGAPVALDIVGPVGDPAYWAACQEAMAHLPPHVQARYLGPVEPAQVLSTLARYELFILPTLAENNGYVIHEAMLAGCALLISDETPWRNLAQAGIGEDLPLRHSQFADALTRFAALSSADRLAVRERARQYGLQRMEADTDVAATRAMWTRGAR